MGSYIYETKFNGLDPILDLAPGRCWFTKESPDTIIAVDNAEDVLNSNSSQGLRIRLGDAYALPFGESHFQGVFCCWLVEHLTEPLRATSELHRVLQPGGYACVIAPTRLRTTCRTSTMIARTSAPSLKRPWRSWRPRPASSVSDHIPALYEASATSCRRRASVGRPHT